MAVAAVVVLACTACGQGGAASASGTGADNTAQETGTSGDIQGAAGQAGISEDIQGAAGQAGTSGDIQGAAGQAGTSGDIQGAAGQAGDSGDTWEALPLNVIDDNYRNYYEIFVYSYADSDGDGTGDLQGVRKKLPYIRDMGFNGIWLMPVCPSPTYHKYDVTDYCAIDPAYGTMEDLRALLDDAHENDMSVIIDFVMNHTSSKHPWFVSACDHLKSLAPEDERSLEKIAEECPYVGYYHFSREKESGTYYEVPGTPFFYEGEFWSEMPDLDYSSGALWGEFEKIIDFWIENGIDGFRMDATMHFEEDDTGFNTKVMNRVYSYAKEKDPDFYMVSEVWAAKKTIADYYASETPSLFNFDAGGPEGKLIGAARGSLKAESFVNAMKQYEDDFSASYSGYIDAPFLTNHDMGRVSNALNGDEDALKFAGGLLLSMNGSPFVYYGEEIGMKSKGTKDENKRLPMLWSYEPGSAVGLKPGELSEDGTGPAKGPSDADPGIESKFPGVKEQLSDQDSILNYYKKALLIRNQNPEIARGKITVLPELTDGNLACILKEYEGKKIAVLYYNAKEGAADITADQLKSLGKALDPSGDSSPEIVGYLTVDGSSVTFSETGLTLPARCIVYLKTF